MKRRIYYFAVALLVVSIALGAVILRDHTAPVALLHRTSAESYAPDSPDLAAAYFRDQRLSENGNIPEDAAPDSYRLAKLYREKARNVRRPETVTWSWIGPGNIGGRMRSMIIDPTDPDRIFAGGVSGGIWRSDDGANTWTPVADEMSNLAVTCMIAMFGTEPDTFSPGPVKAAFSNKRPIPRTHPSRVPAFFVLLTAAIPGRTLRAPRGQLGTWLATWR